MLIVAVFLTLLASMMGIVYRRVVVALKPASVGDSHQTSSVRTLQATTSTGRQGACYLPRGGRRQGRRRALRLWLDLEGS